MSPARKVGGPRHPERVHQREPDPEEGANRPLVPKETDGPVDQGGRGESAPPPEDPRKKSSGHGKKTWNQ